MGLCRVFSDKEYTCQCRRLRRWDTIPFLGQEHPPRGGNGNPLSPVFLPGKFHGQRSLAGYSPWVAKSQTQLSTHTHIHTHSHCTYEHLHRCCIQFLTVQLSGKDFLVHLQPWFPRETSCSLCARRPEVMAV